jgi:GTP-dependent dephospho-CoA kinase
MRIDYVLTPELRLKLKEPFGNLIEGSFEGTTAKLQEQIDKEKPPMIITVGDVVTKNLHDHQLHPQISIIDHISLRDQKTQPTQAHGEQTVHVKNPQGTITDEAVEVIRKAIAKGNHTHIVVDGEEDLLTLIAVKYASENSFVIYGQPKVGIVVVKVTQHNKVQVQEFLNAMKI